MQTKENSGKSNTKNSMTNSKEEILLATQFLDSSYSVREREFLLSKGITSQPKCVVCGESVHVTNYKNGWARATLPETCSKSCRLIYVKDPTKYLEVDRIDPLSIPDSVIDEIKSIPAASLSQAFSTTHPNHKLYKTVLGATQFLDDVCPENKISFSLRVFCVLNQINSVPTCPECGDLVLTKVKSSGYIESFPVYCSDECRTKNSKKLPAEIHEKLNDYEWMYNHRISMQLSYSDIGKILGISSIPVREYARKHGLDKEKFNESQPFTMSKLRDRDWLYHAHVVEKKTCEMIAAEIGSSKATVSVWLSRHEIPTNNPNSYPKKFLKESGPQKEIRQYLESILGISISADEDRTILDGQGIDIVIPGSNVCVEHHGLFRHAYNPAGTTPASTKGRHYHRNKYLKAREKGYHLIQIFGDLWQYKKDIVKSILASKFGKTSKIYARKCKIVSISNGIKNLFLNENHIQGQDSSSIRFGLEYEGSLVAVMTFRKNGRGKSQDKPTWELNRYCNLKFTTVVGGFSKLLKHFRSMYDGSIVSYSDCMWSNGSVYERHGFELLREDPAAYHYIEKSGDKRAKHRTNFMKHKIASSDDPRSEKTIMEEAGYRIIWDAGLRVWVLPEGKLISG